MEHLPAKCHLIQDMIESPFGLIQKVRDCCPCRSISIQDLRKRWSTKVLISGLRQCQVQELRMETLDHQEMGRTQHGQSHRQKVLELGQDHFCWCLMVNDCLWLLIENRLTISQE